jgi:precorrin-2 dehydrogenase / sirohydrochlorin ferrochelatase
LEPVFKPGDPVLGDVMTWYALNLRLEGHPCLIVGGGTVACAKAGPLVRAGARVSVVAPEIAPALRDMEGVRFAERPFKDSDTIGASLVIAATNDPEVNRRVAIAALAAGAWCCVADDPDAGDFAVPAALTRGDLTVTVSTGGASPSLARRLRDELEEIIPPEYEDYVAFLGRARVIVKDSIANPATRRHILGYLASRSGWDRYRGLGPEEREAWLHAVIASEGDTP